MAQFEVFRMAGGGDLVIDCQSEVLRHLNTRFAIPLMPVDQAPAPGAKLNPQFEIEGTQVSMVTQFAGSVPLSEMTEFVCSLDHKRYEILNAIDVLVTGV